MSREELISQLEFYRDIGISQIDVGPVRARTMGPGDAPAQAIPTGETMSLDEIRKDLGDCQRCQLAGTRTNIVFGSGSPDARLVFVGEAPGSDEDRQGIPFVGRASF